jgi:hypothetical protein
VYPAGYSSQHSKTNFLKSPQDYSRFSLVVWQPHNSSSLDEKQHHRPKEKAVSREAKAAGTVAILTILKTLIEMWAGSVLRILDPTKKSVF